MTKQRKKQKLSLYEGRMHMPSCNQSSRLKTVLRSQRIHIDAHDALSTPLVVLRLCPSQPKPSARRLARKLICVWILRNLTEPAAGLLLLVPVLAHTPDPPAPPAVGVFDPLPITHHAPHHPDPSRANTDLALSLPQSHPKQPHPKTPTGSYSKRATNSLPRLLIRPSTAWVRP